MARQMYNRPTAIGYEREAGYGWVNAACMEGRVWFRCEGVPPELNSAQCRELAAWLVERAGEMEAER